jgi:hypothetical protein
MTMEWEVINTYTPTNLEKEPMYFNRMGRYRDMQPKETGEKGDMDSNGMG